MNLYIALAAFLIGSLVSVSEGREVEGVVKYAINEFEDLNIMEVIRHMSQPKGRLGKYQFINCDKDGDLLNVTKLDFSPDPVTFPGTLGVDFAGSIKKTLDAPLKAEVILERKVGSSWIEIPCIGNIGSCTYDDLCDLLSGATCPPPFITNGVPCKCPFPAGSYKLPQISIDVDAAVFPPGDYHAKGTVVTGDSGEVSVGCIELYASFA